MRVLVCLLFLIISFGCFGQKEINIQRNDEWPKDSAEYDEGDLSFDGLPMDTVPVIMLVTDTSKLTTNFPFAMKGYKVWFRPSVHPIGIFGDTNPQYLDGDKGKLPPDHIVWQSIEIK